MTEPCVMAYNEHSKLVPVPLSVNAIWRCNSEGEKNQRGNRGYMSIVVLMQADGHGT